MKRTLPILACLFLARSAVADGSQLASAAREEIEQSNRETPQIQTAIQTAQERVATAEQRLANGEVLLRMKQYDASVAALTEVVEGFPNTRAQADAYWLRSEAFYADKQYLSAKRDLKSIIDHGNETIYAPYVSKALGRLVDVSIRICGATDVSCLSALDDVFQKLSAIPSTLVDAALQYARGKALYFRRDYSAARASFGAIPNTSPFAHQARYFEGLIALKTAPTVPGKKAGEQKPDFKPAIEAFRKVAELALDTPEHRQVSDLAWMAIGRIHYENENFEQAVEAYGHVNRESKEFDTMLYELAWVYVRGGDFIRAERALEVLTLADPDASFAADAALLRADLLLRKGQFRKALGVYETVRVKYDPMREKVETFLSTTGGNVVAFYERLTNRDLDAFDQSGDLPPLAIRWAREGGERAFAILDDLSRCKKLIHESEDLITRLVALTDSSNRVRAFPELMAGERKALGLLNKIARARVLLGKGLDEEEPATVSGELEAVRVRRRELQKTVEAVPVTEADFVGREESGLAQWNATSQKLTLSFQQVDRLQAVVNGLRRVMSEDAKRGVARDPAAREQLRLELENEERTLKQFSQMAAELRKQIDVGRAQVGIGDSRFQSDASARAEYRTVLEREVELLRSGVAGASPQNYAARVSPILADARTSEDRLIEAFNRIDAQVASRIGDLRRKIDDESSKVTGFKEQLSKLDEESRGVVGEIAQNNFLRVRDRLRDIVLRADIGITEQAWEVRVEEMERVRMLQSERVREEQLLDEELKEVLDDAGEQQSTSGK